MQMLQHSYRGLDLLVRVNLDRFLSILAIVGALTCAAGVTTLF